MPLWTLEELTLISKTFKHVEFNKGSVCGITDEHPLQMNSRSKREKKELKQRKENHNAI
jgi:hypothetical protein